jgi:hypothetical protein
MSENTPQASDKASIEEAESILLEVREMCVRNGMSKDDAAYVCNVLWTGAHQPAIHSLEEYQRLSGAYKLMCKALAKDDYRSPKAIRIDAIGAELLRFEEEYEAEHGCEPPVSKDDSR